MMDTPDFTRTRQVLTEIDTRQLRRDARWSARYITDAEILHLTAAEEQDRLLLCEAFYADTQDRNARDNCRLLSVAAIRRMVEGR